jgi:hypothetical protein
LKMFIDLKFLIDKTTLETSPPWEIFLYNKEG